MEVEEAAGGGRGGGGGTGGPGGQPLGQGAHTGEHDRRGTHFLGTAFAVRGRRKKHGPAQEEARVGGGRSGVRTAVAAVAS